VASNRSGGVMSEKPIDRHFNTASNRGAVSEKPLD
jgi:hypothetical protein